MSKCTLRARLALCAVIFSCLSVGCGSNLYRMAPVRGRVTCQGKPAVGAVVVFQPIDAPGKTSRPAGHPGGASSGTVGEDGTFTLTSVDGKSGAGALVGPHQVIFRPPPTKRPTLSADDRASMSPEEIKKAEDINRSLPVYPPLPCGDKITPAEVEVKPGDNDFTFTLQPK